MDVAFQVGQEVNGYKITARIGLSSYTAENERYRINFRTDAGQGKNHFKVLHAFDKKSQIHIYSTRSQLKFIPIVKGFSDLLYTAYRNENHR